jgi:hypothetical protein
MTRTRYAKASPNVPGQSSHAFAMPASPVMTTRPYNFFDIATAVSAIRFEKPHSLSYHDITRTKVPF